MRRSRRTARAAWGRRLLRAGASVALVLAGPCSVALVSVAHAQTWENLPLLPFVGPNGQGIDALGFLRAEGAGAASPALDSLVAFSFAQSTLLYNPSGAAGAAGDNDWRGAWHALCENSHCAPESGLVTAVNAIVFGGASGGTGLAYSLNRGRTWAFVVDSLYGHPVHESALPGLAAPDGARGLIAVVSDDGNVARSLGGGAPGTWAQAGNGLGYSVAFGEVPPSPALPTGRLLLAVWNGVSGSTDGGLSFQPAAGLYGFAAYIGWSFAFVPVEGHPYGGVAFAGVDNVPLVPHPAAEVHRSDDGGATWTLAHRFTPEETGLPVQHGDFGDFYPLARPVLLATPDGALWSGVSYQSGSYLQGVIMRSTDLGQTWARADAGFTGYDHPDGIPRAYGWRVRDLELARDGRLYAATDRGVWCTLAPVVSAEAWPTPASAALAVSVRPNPSAGGAVSLVLSASAAVEARVEVVDAAGRRVAAFASWATPEGAVVPLSTAGWASGAYVARASVGRHTESVAARFTVAR